MGNLDIFLFIVSGLYVSGWLVHWIFIPTRIVNLILRPQSKLLEDVEEIFHAFSLKGSLLSRTHASYSIRLEYNAVLIA